MATSWQLTNPISAIIFDCDGTLSSIEGIDELAKQRNVEPIVQRLTQDAMGKSGMTKDLYSKRLELVKPSAAEVAALGNEYINNQAPDVLAAINLFKRLNKTIYIISAGLLPSVKIFANYLEIANENIFAVNVQFDTEGRYVGFDEASPLINKYGKREIVDQIKLSHANIAFIGDGLSDYEVYDLVTRFVGYGGVFYRENIAELCQFYIKTISMAALLPLLLTEAEVSHLTHEEKSIYQKGLEHIKNNKVVINNLSSI